jgi:hypothetical protein
MFSVGYGTCGSDGLYRDVKGRTLKIASSWMSSWHDQPTRLDATHGTSNQWQSSGLLETTRRLELAVVIGKLGIYIPLYTLREHVWHMSTILRMDHQDYYSSQNSSQFTLIVDFIGSKTWDSRKHVHHCCRTEGDWSQMNNWLTSWMIKWTKLVTDSDYGRVYSDWQRVYFGIRSKGQHSSTMA